MITPEEILTVATVSLSLNQLPPPSPLVLNAVVPLKQIESAPLIVPAFGAAVTVTVVDAVSFAQPPVPVTMYLIVDVPAETAVTSPLPSIVATPVDAELHEPPVPVVVKVSVPFVHNAIVPLISPASGTDVIVNTLVSNTSAQPPVPVTVYVIVTVPAPTTVTTPLPELIVAVSVSPLVHVPPPTVDVNVVEPVEQIACVPLNVPALGAAVTVTTVDAVSFAQPPVPATIYLIVDVPAETAVTSPLPSIVAIPVDTELHVPPVPVVVKVSVPFEQIPVVPLMLPANGAEVITMSFGDSTSLQPPKPIIL